MIEIQSHRIRGLEHKGAGTEKVYFIMVPATELNDVWWQLSYLTFQFSFLQESRHPINVDWLMALDKDALKKPLLVLATLKPKPHVFLRTSPPNHWYIFFREEANAHQLPSLWDVMKMGLEQQTLTSGLLPTSFPLEDSPDPWSSSPKTSWIPGWKSC